MTNVLVFCVDQMRADHMGCAGNPVVRTPNIDRLAARGTRFSRAYCNNPICMPARASMFTGLLPRDHGVRINGQALRTDLPTLPGVLADAGYRTHSAGKLHLTPWVPMVSPADTERYPECMDYWNHGDIREVPEPYYGFETVDFVGGHVSYAYGDYVRWLEERGGDRAGLAEQNALWRSSTQPDCYKMAMREELHYNRYIADSTIGVIEDSATDGSAPFFTWCSFPDPHHPFAAPQPYCDMYDPADMPPPVRRDGEHDDLPPVYRRIVSGEKNPYHCDNSAVSDEGRNQMLALTYGMISHIDAEIGRVLDALDRTGQAGNTAVALISDHGDMMGDHSLFYKGMYTFRGCANIPFIVAAPGMPGGRSTDALVSQIDLMPGVLDLCGVPLPGTDWVTQEEPFERGFERPLELYPGRSWRGLLDGSATGEAARRSLALQEIGRTHVVATGGRGCDEPSQERAARESVVIENDDPTSGYQARALVTPTHRITVYPGTQEGELFDLANDPDELHNLWHVPACAGLRADLVSRLLAEYSRRTPFYPIPPWNS